jgi:hypothetical protein
VRYAQKLWIDDDTLRDLRGAIRVTDGLVLATASAHTPTLTLVAVK